MTQMRDRTIKPGEEGWKKIVGNVGEGQGKPDAEAGQPPAPRPQHEPSVPQQQHVPNQALQPAASTSSPQSYTQPYPLQLRLDLTDYLYELLKDRQLPKTPEIDALAQRMRRVGNPTAYAHAKLMVDVLGVESLDIRNMPVVKGAYSSTVKPQPGQPNIRGTIRNILSGGKNVTVTNDEIHVGDLHITDKGIQIGNTFIDEDGNVTNIRPGQKNVYSPTGAVKYVPGSELVANMVTIGKASGYVTSIFGQIALVTGSSPDFANASLDELVELSTLPALVPLIPELEFVQDLFQAALKTDSPFNCPYFIVMEMQPPSARLLAAKALESAYKDRSINEPPRHIFPLRTYDSLDHMCVAVGMQLRSLESVMLIPDQLMRKEADLLGITDVQPFERSYKEAWESAIQRFTP